MRWFGKKIVWLSSSDSLIFFYGFLIKGFFVDALRHTCCWPLPRRWFEHIECSGKKLSFVKKEETLSVFVCLPGKLPLALESHFCPPYHPTPTQRLWVLPPPELREPPLWNIALYPFVYSFVSPPGLRVAKGIDLGLVILVSLVWSTQYFTHRKNSLTTEIVWKHRDSYSSCRNRMCQKTVAIRESMY